MHEEPQREVIIRKCLLEMLSWLLKSSETRDGGIFFNAYEYLMHFSEWCML